MKRLSVCITTYKRARLLDRTLSLLAAQTRQPDEVIVSDDCSPDDTPAVAERWRPAFRSFTYRRNPANLYIPGNLNAAVGLAGGDYVATLHDADEFEPTLLEKWEASLERYPSAGFVFCAVSTGEFRGATDGTPRVVRLNRSTVLHVYPTKALYRHDVDPLTPGRDFFERHLLHAPYSVVWPILMTRREAYARLLPFDPQFGWMADVDMWMRMCLHFDVAYVEEPLLHLDNSPTAERAFDWGRQEMLRRIQRVNIERFYGDSPERLRRELTRHQKVFRRWYLRKVATLAARGQPRQALAGARLLLGSTR